MVAKDCFFLLKWCVVVTWLWFQFHARAVIIPELKLIKVPFKLSPVSSSHHALLSYYVRMLFWMLQLGIEVRIHGFLSLNPHLLLLLVSTSDQELVQ